MNEAVQPWSAQMALFVLIAPFISRVNLPNLLCLKFAAGFIFPIKAIHNKPVLSYVIIHACVTVCGFLCFDDL